MTSPVVIDTNVVVAGLLTNRKESPTARILTSMLDGRLYFLLSVELLGECRDMLLRPRIRQRHKLTEDDVHVLLTRLAENGAFRELTQTATAPDPGDAHIWALLATMKDVVLVTGDKLLLDNPPEGRRVISPEAFCRRL